MSELTGITEVTFAIAKESADNMKIHCTEVKESEDVQP